MSKSTAPVAPSGTRSTACPTAALASFLAGLSTQTRTPKDAATRMSSALSGAAFRRPVCRSARSWHWRSPEGLWTLRATPLARTVRGSDGRGGLSTAERSRVVAVSSERAPQAPGRRRVRRGTDRRCSPRAAASGVQTWCASRRQALCARFRALRTRSSATLASLLPGQCARCCIWTSLVTRTRARPAPDR
jgi:hypothetical protein